MGQREIDPDRANRELALFEELVHKHVDLVHSVALSWTGDPAKAEELAQTAFLKAWHAFPGFQPGTNFKAWVLKIARNEFLDQKRTEAAAEATRSVEQLPMGEEPQAAVPEPSVVDPESREVFYDLFGDEIARMLRKLPMEYQLAVLLCDVEGLGYQEIAETLSLPIGTVRSRIHRGRARLAELLRAHAARLGYAREPKP